MADTEEKAGCLASILVILAIIGMCVVHLCLCYYVYKTSTFLAVVLTFVLPVVSELFWLGATLGQYGFTWVHLLFCICGVFYFIGGLLPKIAENRAEARSRREEKRRQECEAERAARESAVRARANAEFSPAAATAIANRQVIDQKIATQRAVQTPVITPQQPVSQEEQLRRRAELAERRCQELSAELREQKEKSQADILTVQIEELERSLIMSSSLPPDGAADLKQELMEKKARLFDLQRKQQ